ncbi:MAG TPA: hypothetical protein GXX23_05885 [Firmicutes bacterium]|nr:hypothetical protein [Candidatus Fermentithermobacillaceae bacterium]
MEQEIRDSGVTPLGGVPWGTHVCHFYDTKAEVLEILVPYFRAGLENDECCVWVCSDPVGVEEALDALQEAVPGLQRYLETGQLEVVRFDGWYLKRDGSFEAEEVLRQWKMRLVHARAAGYQGVRVAGITSWVENRLWKAFKDYEASLSGAIGKDNILVMCSYPCSLPTASHVVDVVRNHQYALVRSETGWDLIECGRFWEREWESLFDDIEEGVLVVGRRGEILAANRSLLKCFRVKSMRELGSDLSELTAKFRLRPEDPHDHVPLLEATSSDRRSNYLATIPEGRDSIELSIRTVYVCPTTYFSERHLVLIRDVTEIRRLERMKDRFVQVMGHEMKNPIQVMNALVPLMNMMETPDISTIRRYARTLHTQITQLSSLIEDLLTACAAEDRDLLILRRPADLVDLVEDWIDSLVSVKRHKVIRLFSNVERIPVFVDGKRIRGILTAVFENAVNYSPEGTRIWIDVKREPSCALVIIEDEGVGIPEGEMERVFQAFYRGSNIDQSDTDGVGVGLFIGKKVARQHGGDLWAEKRHGGGTRMILRLPLLEERVDLVSSAMDG